MVYKDKVYQNAGSGHVFFQLFHVFEIYMEVIFKE